MLWSWTRSSLRNSLYSLLGSSRPSAAAAEQAEVDIDDIRAAMLALIDGVEGERVAHVTRRIRYAGDVQGLWFLRGDLMALLAASRGESVALEQIEAVSGLFATLLPKGLRARPSPLRFGDRSGDSMHHR